MKKIVLIMLGIFLFFASTANFSAKSPRSKEEPGAGCTQRKLSLVTPTISRDIDKLTANLKFYKKYLRFIDKIIVIGDEKIEKLLKKTSLLSGIKIEFIDENTLIDTVKVKKLINEIDPKASKHSGWYIQQFLKMQYSKICKDDYYLIWDSDTVPLKNIEMFNSKGKPFFDVKTEYHVPYFTTMTKLFPSLYKMHEFSFISEHMLIKTSFMNELINMIKDNKKIPGDTWYEKIINSVNIADLRCSGFSEFETYGTFVQKYHPKIYEIRKWNSLRNGKEKYNFKKLSDNDILKLSKNYHAITFEH